MGATPNPDGSYSIDCSAEKHLSKMTLTFAGHPFQIGPEDYVFFEEDEGTCISAFWGHDWPAPSREFAVIGTAFLRKWYSVFDVGAKTISFAKAKP